MLEAGALVIKQSTASCNVYYIFGHRNKIHNQSRKTLEKFQEALNYIERLTKNGTILFVGTKRQCREIIKMKQLSALHLSLTIDG